MLEQSGYPYKFDPAKCQECEGNCCIGESGYIWINKQEILDLAKYLDISVEDLGMRYLLKAGYKYSIKEKKIGDNNYACIFFDMQKRQCSIYEVRPKQCRTFPFWEHFKTNVEEVKQECPAIVE